MTSAHWRLRAAVLLSAGAFGVHQLRYLVAYGDDSRRELALQGHAYLAVVAPLLAVIFVLAFAEFLLRVLRARYDGAGPPPVPGFRRLWGVATVLLLVAFAAQESVEGALASGHPGGLAAIFGSGGWTSVPLAVAIGLVIALALRGAARALELAARPLLTIRLRAPLAAARISRGTVARTAGALALNVGGRGPPIPSVR